MPILTFHREPIQYDHIITLSPPRPIKDINLKSPIKSDTMTVYFNGQAEIVYSVIEQTRDDQSTQTIYIKIHHDLDFQ